MLKKILAILTSIISIVVSFVIGLAVFSLLVYPTNEYLSVIFSIISIFISNYYLEKLRKKLFKLKTTKPFLVPLTTTIVFSIFMVFIFLVPTKTYKSTGSIVPTYGLEPELIPTSTGNEIAVYQQGTGKKDGKYPILFIAGGPGGYPTKSVSEFLDKFVELGYTTYAFDPIGVMASPTPKSLNDYSIENEVAVIGDILDYYHIKKVNLIASSYGGNVAPRFIEKSPERVNAYLASDTAPLYSLHENYPGQDKDKKFSASIEDLRIDPSKKNTVPAVISYASIKQIARIGFGMFLQRTLKKDDIPYGSSEEYDYFINLLMMASLDGVPKDGKVTRHLNYLANQQILKSIDSSPDYTKNLKKKKTPSVLVVQPEFGLVQWQFHHQYKEYLENTKFIAVPGAPHSVWTTKEGEKMLIRNGDALFSGEDIRDEYKSEINPFPAVK